MSNNWLSVFFDETRNNGYEITEIVDTDGEGTIGAIAVKETVKVPIGWAYYEQWYGTRVTVTIGNERITLREFTPRDVEEETEFREWIKTSLGKEIK